jgi:5-methylcytosine-specific restriction endonuclease McrA
VKPVSEFHKNKSDPSGIARRCKVCKRAEHDARYAARLQCYSPVTHKVCRDCGVEKPASEFGRQTAARDGLTSYCNACNRLRSADYYVANREALIQKVWVYQKRNPGMNRSARMACRQNERAKQSGAEGTFTAQDWRDLLDYYGNRCAYCLRHADEVGELTADHIYPLSRGGSGGIENIVPSCMRCNCSKGNKNLLEFASWQDNAVRILSAA